MTKITEEASRQPLIDLPLECPVAERYAECSMEPQDKFYTIDKPVNEDFSQSPTELPLGIFSLAGCSPETKTIKMKSCDTEIDLFVNIDIPDRNTRFLINDTIVPELDWLASNFTDDYLCALETMNISVVSQEELDGGAYVGGYYDYQSNHVEMRFVAGELLAILDKKPKTEEEVFNYNWSKYRFQTTLYHELGGHFREDQEFNNPETPFPNTAAFKNHASISHTQLPECSALVYLSNCYELDIEDAMVGDFTGTGFGVLTDPPFIYGAAGASEDVAQSMSQELFLRRHQGENPSEDIALSAFLDHVWYDYTDRGLLKMQVAAEYLDTFVVD